MPVNYNKYLLSNEWDIIRQQILQRDNNLCIECGSNKDVSVHHKTSI